MVKFLFFTTILWTTSYVFSQKNINLNGYRHHIYMDDDGSFIILSEYEEGTAMTTYDEEGNQLDMKKIELIRPVLYDSERKRWFTADVENKKIIIKELDISGKVTTTEIKNDMVRKYHKFAVYMNGHTLEAYVVSEADDEIPYIFVEYNTDDKTHKLVNYKNMTGISGNVSFVGTRDHRKYFVNSVKDKKTGVFHVSLLAIDVNNQINTIPVTDVPISMGKTWFKAANGIFPVERRYDDDLYFTIDSDINNIKGGFVIDMELAYQVYKIDAADHTSYINFTIPMNAPALPHFPVYFKEEEGITYFTITDEKNTRMLVSSDFDSDETQISIFPALTISDLMYYSEDYEDLYAKAADKATGLFKVCNGYARLITIDFTGKGVLYLQKENE